jgi:uncharacterized protein YukE
MAPPTKESIKVATDALRKEAGVWDNESAEMGKAVAKADSLRMTRLQAGIFQLIVTSYEPAVDQIVARSTEGEHQMTEVGKTLRDVANAYDADEAANEHRLRNIY